MNILGLEAVVFGVTEMDRCIAFWDDFGLQKQESDGNGARFTTADGGTVVVRKHDDPELPATSEDGATAREVIWGVDGPATLDAIAEELAKDREIRRDEDGTVHAVDPSGFGIAFRVSTLTPVKTEPTPYNAPGAESRIDRPGTVYDRARPSHLAHAVFRTPDLEPMFDFYIGRLGFNLTDSYPGRGYFLRGGKSQEHHNLFIFNPDGTKGFHHVAFNCRDIHEVFGGGLHMTNKGWETHIGPGRHTVTSACATFRWEE